MRGKLRANGDHAWASKTERRWIAPPALVTAANRTAEVSQASTRRYEAGSNGTTSKLALYLFTSSTTPNTNATVVAAWAIQKLNIRFVRRASNSASR